MSSFTKLVRAPVTSAAVVLLWLTLARSTSLGNVLFGLGLGLSVPIVTSSLLPTKTRLRKPWLILRFTLLVAYDVVQSNFEIAWDLLRFRRRRPISKFVVVPLELRDPAGLAALAVVTSIVPGTVWSELALDRSKLLLHVWNIEEEGSFIARYKDRYEKPLREIFE